MVRKGFDESIRGFDMRDYEEEPWNFLTVSQPLEKVGAPGMPRLPKLLSVAKEAAFKVWRLVLPLKIVAVALGIVALGGLGWLVYLGRDAALISPLGLAAAVSGAVLTVVAGALGLGAIVSLISYRKTISQILWGAALAVFGWAAAAIHLWPFDRLYLQQGKVRKREKRPQ